MEIRNIESFLAYWQKIHQRSRRVIDAIPGEQIESRPRPEMWSFGDLIRHLAALERFMFAENAAGRPSGYPGCGEELASGYPAVVRYFEQQNEDAVAILASLSDERLAERCQTPGGASLPVWKWLRAMVEHHCHHRAQIYQNLALLGIDTPPLYGLTSEEVFARSRG